MNCCQRFQKFTTRWSWRKSALPMWINVKSERIKPLRKRKENEEKNDENFFSHVRNTRLTNRRVKGFSIRFEWSGTVDQIGVFSNGLKIEEKTANSIFLLRFSFDEHQKCSSTNLNVSMDHNQVLKVSPNTNWSCSNVSNAKTRKIHRHRSKLFLLFLLLKFLRIFRNNFHVVVANFVPKFSIEP